MRTVEVVKTARGWHVTRRYCGRTMATQFFSTVVPEGMKGKKKIAAFLSGVEAQKDAYVTEWTGE